MANIKFLYVKEVPLEMHKARVIPKMQLKPIEERVKRNKMAGNNSYLYRNEDTFIDMLTDSGVNAMSDQQLAAMMQADDAYAGSESFYKFEEAMQRVFNMKYVLVAHQGRACEHLLAWSFIKEG